MADVADLRSESVLAGRAIAGEWIAAGLNGVGVRLPAPTVEFIAAAVVAALLSAGWACPYEVVRGKADSG